MPGPTELLILLAIVALLFGTKKLRSMGGDLGSAINSFRNALKNDAIFWKLAGQMKKTKNGDIARQLWKLACLKKTCLKMLVDSGNLSEKEKVFVLKEKEFTWFASQPK